MFFKKYRLPLIVLMGTLALQALASVFSEPFKSLYTLGINRWMIQGVSFITGFFPFSLFEMLIYTGLFILFFYVGQSIYISWRNRSFTQLGLMFLNILMAAILIYSTFTLMWGLNYYRPNVALDFNLDMKNDSEKEKLKKLYLYLIDETNAAWVPLDKNRSDDFRRARLGFDALGGDYPFLGGRYGIAKPVAASKLMNYPRITGMYAPFTAEPNINMLVPDVARLFTIMHEMAHQRGIAHEDEANFVAFLTCKSHPDADFRYAGYFNALRYVRQAIREDDPAWLIEHDHLLIAEVIDDMNALALFWSDYESPFESMFKRVHESYLNFNNMGEYVAVVDFLVAYYRQNL